MNGTESTIDCLRTSFGGSGLDVVQEFDLTTVVQMSGTESTINCLRTSFRRIRFRRSSRV